MTSLELEDPRSLMDPASVFFASGRHPGLFVVCEGLDRAGKTALLAHTLAYLRAEDVKAHYRKGLKSRSIVSRYSGIPPTTISYLKDLYYQDKRIVRPLLDHGFTVLQDRWYESVLNYHGHDRDDAASAHERAFGEYFRPRLLAPDLYVHVTVSLEERLRRLAATPDDEGHMLLYRDPGLILEKEARLLAEWRAFRGPKHIIDTTHTTPQQAGFELACHVLAYVHLHNLFKRPSAGLLHGPGQLRDRVLRDPR